MVPFPFLRCFNHFSRFILIIPIISHISFTFWSKCLLWVYCDCLVEEQREYYIKQFETMMSDLKGAIPGQTAKEFFEKSRLPVSDLSKIWQLSDADCDGCLSLEEFCTAMHLVILRRNNVRIPDRLPAQLQPYELLTGPEGDLDGGFAALHDDVDMETPAQVVGKGEPGKAAQKEEDPTLQSFSSTTEEEELTGRPRKARPVAFDTKPPMV